MRQTKDAKKRDAHKTADNSLLGYTEPGTPGAEDVVSANECTGLVMAPPEDEAQAEAYTDLYPIPKPENDVQNGLQSPQKTTKK